VNALTQHFIVEAEIANSAEPPLIVMEIKFAYLLEFL